MAAPSAREAGKAAFNRGDYAAAVRARGMRFPATRRQETAAARRQSTCRVNAALCARRWSATPPRCATSPPQTSSSGASSRDPLTSPPQRAEAAPLIPRLLVCNAAATARWRTWRRARLRRRCATRCPPPRCAPTTSKAGTARHVFSCNRCCGSVMYNARADIPITLRRARRCKRWVARAPPWWR